MITRAFNWPPERLKKLSPLGAVEYIVIHHTDSGDVPVETIDNWHVNRGWSGVGYHYIVRKNGDVEKGRPDDKLGAHVQGHNHHSIGVVLTGNFMSDVPAGAQMDALDKLLVELKRKHPKAKVVRHRDLQNTSCPGNMFPWGSSPAKNQIKPEVKPMDWKEKIMQDAKDAGLVSEKHNPDDPAPKWFVLAVIMRAMKGEKSE